MTSGYQCSMCGQHHDDLLTDQAYKLPDAVWAIPERDRAEKARFNSDLCQMGERYFIRCVLGVPFTESEGEFGWGAWAEVDWSTFERYLELYDEDGSGEPPKDGILANDLPPYPSSIGSPVKIQFRDPTKRPRLSLLPEDFSLLADEQRKGIDDKRWHDILALC